jgi:hypothetical protein
MLYVESAAQQGITTELIDLLRRLEPVDADELNPTESRLNVFFPECDISVQVVSAPRRPTLRLSFTAAVRDREPSLDTWWCRWHVDAPRAGLAEFLVETISRERVRFQRMMCEGVRRRR